VAHHAAAASFCLVSPLMTRRRFAFWLGFGLFTLADKLRIGGFDVLAAATMRAAERPESDKPAAPPEHWTTVEDGGWRWFVRETFIDGQWALSGSTRRRDRTTGEPEEGTASDYLDEKLVPIALRGGKQREATELPAALEAEFARRSPHPKRKGRHGRPPSKWLRNLDAEEIRIWLKTIDVPEAGVSGMTYWEHLTRDHGFAPHKIEGLTEEEQAELHAAAHYGY
jgi:hypothetical protein